MGLFSISLDIAFGQHLAEMQHRDALGDLAHERHVVLDHDDGMAALEIVDDQRGLVRLRLGHAGGRLVEQDDLRVLRDQQPELQPLGLAVAEIGGDPIGLLGEADQLQHLIDVLLGARRRNRSRDWRTRRASCSSPLRDCGGRSVP